MSEGVEQVGLYGVGHFGYAMLRRLEPRAGTDIALRAFDRNEQVRHALERDRRHPIHDTESEFSTHVEIVHDVAALMKDLDVLILAVTSNSTREVAEAVGGQPWSGPLIMVNTAKALDFKTGRRLSEIVAKSIPRPPALYTYAALAGGTIASDVLHDQPLGMTIACGDGATLPRLKRLFGSAQMWVQTTTDLAGVEYAGALKNVVSICSGLARGLGLNFGAQTHLISRIAWEVEDFCVRKLGAERTTFSIGSQCWGSDLWMSCLGPTRNRELGEMIGKGASLDEANLKMARLNKTVEGVQTLRAMESIFREHPDELPLLRAAERVILHAAPASDLIDALMRDDEVGLSEAEPQHGETGRGV
ncbi:MAG: hypothetical protein EA376_05910 [Phycisphaeraceae bacterium]|nr:MAG: hypothetical protein EA376_05910 [Phycisphaeraceae bacterium]